MRVEKLEEQEICKIGHAFGYYDYGDETGMAACFPSQEAVAVYINGYARMTIKGGFLYTTSERREAYIAYKLPGQKIGISAGMELVGTRDYGAYGKIYDLIRYPDGYEEKL